MRHFGVVLVAALLGALGITATAGAAAPPTPWSVDNPIKLDILGEWAHPDDDTSIIGPCGVWHHRYGARCGIIMVTRGEGGGNAVGSEIGPALGLRRENEDRVAHYRSGTVDIFNLDQVDFFYNTSAPLTQFFWGHDETLRRVTRVIRATRPEVYIGFTPTLAAGHGHHQQAGRYIWEGVLAAANPAMFPEQLTGPHALSTWQVKRIFSGGSTAGTGGTTTSANCTTGFVPAATNLDTVVGAWMGYDSPYLWPPGNVQGRPAGSAKIWEQIHLEGTAAYPTQSRVMFQGTATPNCRRFGQTASFVPFQPNTNPDGTPNPLAGRDDAILFGASVADPGGLPRGTLEYITFSRFFNVAGTPFEAAVRMRSGSGAIPAGTVSLTLPSGWTADATSKPIGPITTSGESTAVFTITPSPTATVDANYKIAARFTTGTTTGYTDNVVRIVPPAEGRFQRWGKWAEYDQWLETTAPQAARLGRSAAIQTMAVGETITVPVDVRNWSAVPQTGNVTLTLPAGVTADAVTKPYGTLAPGASTTVNFSVSNSFTNATLPITFTGTPPAGAQNTNVNIGIATSYSAPAGSNSETLSMAIVPKTTIPAAASAPTLDGAEGSGEYTGEALNIGRKWEPGGDNRNCAPPGADCGSTPGSPIGSPDTTYARVTRAGDDLYFFIHIRDDFQSYAVKPDECVAHWLADSVEILIDPRGNASENAMDTAHTFKLGVFPFTNDPTNFNGNGVNGPCWSRDADNHQGFSTGPLAATVDAAPNAPGVQVVSTATWVGTNETTTPHAYAGGGYNLEVKIPMAVLPAAVDPDRMGLNITPYDNDNTAATGTTTLRHIDQSTRLAWSTFGSVQSDPYRWGRATLEGYTPPAGRSPVPRAPNVSHPNMDGSDSPQSIWTSARDGVPIGGRPPAPPNNRIARIDADMTASAAVFDITATGPGRAHIFLWSGVEGYVPVWQTSCDPATNPPPDYGLTACAVTDGTVPPWGTNMSGRIVADRVVSLTAGNHRVSIDLTPAQRSRLATDGSALISFVTPANEVQAFDLPLAEPAVGLTQEPARTRAGDAVTFTASAVGHEPFPGRPTGRVQFTVDGVALGNPVELDEYGRARLSTRLPVGTYRVQAVYLGDGDYARTPSPELEHVTLARPAACRLTLAPGQFRAGKPVRVRAVVNLGGSRYGSVTVRLAGPGIVRTATASGNGVAAFRVFARRAGILRATVRANATTTGCSDTSRILRARRAPAGTGGAELTGRPH
jgi:LmbE family N-acetylglucosaminyl deacetylase